MNKPVLLSLALVAACSSGTTKAAPVPSVTVSVSASASSSSSVSVSVSVSASPTPSLSASPTGTVVTAAGATLVAPQYPKDVPANDDCTKLTPDSTTGAGPCVTATTPRGTMTAVVQGTGHDQHVEVYLRQGATAKDVLESASISGTTDEFLLMTLDPEGDGNTKILVATEADQNVVSQTAPRYQAGYDLVDVPGTVTLHRDLGDGAVGQDAAGHLVDWTSTGGSNAMRATIRFLSGQWRVASQVAEAVPVNPQTFQKG